MPCGLHPQWPHVAEDCPFCATARWPKTAFAFHSLTEREKQIATQFVRHAIGEANAVLIAEGATHVIEFRSGQIIAVRRP